MNLPGLFRQHLKSQKISPATIKNYMVDLNNFFDWLDGKTKIKHQVAGKSTLSLFTQETLEEYKKDLLEENIPFSTINRRLSTLRRFGQFSQSQGWIKTNPASKVENISQKTISQEKMIKEKTLSRFKKYLEKEKASPLTIKNYLSDIRHFLNWLELAG